MFEELIEKNIKVIYKDIQCGKPYNKAVIGILENVKNNFLMIKCSNWSCIINCSDIVSVEEVKTDD